MNSSNLSSVVTTEGFGNGNNLVSLDDLFSKKGQYISAIFQTEKKGSAQHKAVRLEKRTSGTFRAGLDFSNLASVKEGIEAGQREEVGSLPFGKWEKFPYTILHTPAKTTQEIRYVRLYPSLNTTHRVSVQYLVNGVESTKEQFASYLTPSEAREMLEGGKELECFTIKHGNLLQLGKPFNLEG
jgi:hypothetical protein